MALIVVGVVMSIGISILDLSIKQLNLSTNAKDSELAFHAANAGSECARQVRRTFADEMHAGTQVDFECFGTAEYSEVVAIIDTSDPFDTYVDDDSDVDAFHHRAWLTWGASPDVRCTKIEMFTAATSVTGDGATTTNLSTIIPGYPGDNDQNYCESGSKCTIASIRGYNRACANIGGYGVVERDLLLQF